MGHTLDNVIWRKSSYSGNCVEVGMLSEDSRAVRDSKNPGGPKLRFNRDEWRAFTTSIKRGELGLG
jgi:hypothetical protein